MSETPAPTVRFFADVLMAAVALYPDRFLPADDRGEQIRVHIGHIEQIFASFPQRPPKPSKAEEPDGTD